MSRGRGKNFGSRPFQPYRTRNAKRIARILRDVEEMHQVIFIPLGKHELIDLGAFDSRRIER